MRPGPRDHPSEDETPKEPAAPTARLTTLSLELPVAGHRIGKRQTGVLRARVQPETKIPGRKCAMSFPSFTVDLYAHKHKKKASYISIHT